MEYVVLLFLLSFSCSYLYCEQQKDIAQEQLPAELTKWLLAADMEKLKAANRDVVRRGLWAIKTLKLQPEIIELIWIILKGNRSPTEIEVDLMRDMGLMVEHIPEPDLFRLNMSDWTLVDFLAKESLSRRKMGILAMAYSKLHPGEDIINSPSLVNHIRGLLCGFSLYDLGRMKTDTIIALDRDVFQCLLPCTRMQLGVLYKTAILPDALGPSFTWSVEDVHRLGYLFLEASAEQIERIPPKGVAGLSRLVMNALTDVQLRAFTPEQVSFLTEETLVEYRVNIENSSIAAVVNGFLQLVCSCLALAVWSTF